MLSDGRMHNLNMIQQLPESLQVITVHRFLMTDLLACHLWEGGAVGDCPKRRHIVEIQENQWGFVRMLSDQRCGVQDSGWHGPGANYLCKGVQHFTLNLHHAGQAANFRHELDMVKDMWIEENAECITYWGKEHGKIVCGLTWLSQYSAPFTADALPPAQALPQPAPYPFPTDMYQARLDAAHPEFALRPLNEHRDRFHPYQSSSTANSTLEPIPKRRAQRGSDGEPGPIPKRQVQRGSDGVWF